VRATGGAGTAGRAGAIAIMTGAPSLGATATFVSLLM
jgi:hypothetical protein